jgi:hypothetical protein
VELRCDEGPQGNEKPHQDVLPAVPAGERQVRGGQLIGQEGEYAVRRDEEEQQHEEAREHESELKQVGTYHGPESPGEHVDHRDHCAGEQGRQQRPAGHHLQQNRQHEDIRGRGAVEENQHGSEQSGFPVVHGVQLVGDGKAPGAAHAVRKQQREHDGEKIIGETEDEPVGDAVEVRELPDPENAAVPGRHQRRHESRKREQTAPKDEFLRAAAAARGAAKSQVQQEKHVAGDEYPVGSGEMKKGHGEGIVVAAFSPVGTKWRGGGKKQRGVPRTPLAYALSA